MWWRSEVNLSVFFSFATFRMRSSPCDTLSRSAPGTCCAGPAFPWLRPWLHRLRTDCSALFAGLHRLLWAESDFRVRASSATAPAFPSGPPLARQMADAGSPSFRRDPFARNVLLDPQDDNALRNGTAHVAFDSYKRSRSCDKPISWLNHTLHASAVYASWPASPSAHATLASGTARWPLPGPDLHQLIAPASLAPSVGWAKARSTRMALPVAQSSAMSTIFVHLA